MASQATGSPGLDRGPGVWETEAWRATATRWLDDALPQAGRQRTGTVEQPRVRPWGTLLRAPTDRGDVWLKACAAGTASEVPLYGLLARVAPDQILVPLAADADRGWVLLPDGGPSLTQSASSADAQAAGLRDAVPAYAELQLALTPHVEELVAVGVDDMRPAVLPQRFEEALEMTASYAHRAGAHDDAATHTRIASLRDDVARWADELAKAPASPTLDHNDLHADNVLISGGRPRFYDWGDSVVAHPFVSMLTTLTSVRDFTLGCADDDARLVAIRDAYLQPFAAVEGVPAEALVPTLELACRLGRVARTHIWQRAIDASGDDAAPEWVRAPFATLASLLDPSPYGGA